MLFRAYHSYIYTVYQHFSYSWYILISFIGILENLESGQFFEFIYVDMIFVYWCFVEIYLVLIHLIILFWIIVTLKNCIKQLSQMTLNVIIWYCYKHYIITYVHFISVHVGIKVKCSMYNRYLSLALIGIIVSWVNYIISTIYSYYLC